MHQFTLGGDQHERVTVVVTGYERQPTGDYHDDNWLNTEVELMVGAFRGRYQFSTQASEFESFLAQLSALYPSLVGVAEFFTLEGQLALRLEGNSGGAIELTGVAVDVPGTGNRLSFSLSLDQTNLKQAIGGLARVVEAFPVRAS